MLEVCNLECVRGDHRLFTGLSFTLQAGELLHLRGSNGSGKTSLLRTICGLMTPAEGEILWNGENIRANRDTYNSGLLYLGHNNGIKGEFSALENLQFAMSMGGEITPEQVILGALQKLGLAGREDLPTRVLSQGQKRRAALARLLTTQAKLWVLDEPFTALDVRAVGLLQNLIVNHLNNNGLVVLTTHQEVPIDTAVLIEINLDS